MRNGFAFLIVAALAALAYFQTPSASQGAKADYQIDGVHTSVVFRILHGGIAPFYGRFDGVDGSFSVVEGGEGDIAFSIDAASVHSGNGKRDAHIESSDFLSAKEFPKITFTGKLRHVKGDDYEAKGTLTLRGVAQELTVPLKKTGAGKFMGKDRIGFEGSFVVSRKAHGINWRPEALGDEITIMLGVEGAR